MKHTLETLYELELELDNNILTTSGEVLHYTPNQLKDVIEYLFKFDYAVEFLQILAPCTVAEIYNHIIKNANDGEDKRYTAIDIYRHINKIKELHELGIKFNDPVANLVSGKLAEQKKQVIERIINNQFCNTYELNVCAYDLQPLINYIYSRYYNCDDMPINLTYYRTLKDLKTEVDNIISLRLGRNKKYFDTSLLALINLIETLWQNGVEQRITSFEQYCRVARKRFPCVDEHLKSDRGNYHGPSEHTVFNMVRRELLNEGDTTSALALKTQALLNVIRQGNVLEF